MADVPVSKILQGPNTHKFEIFAGTAASMKTVREDSVKSNIAAEREILETVSQGRRVAETNSL